MVGEIAHIIYGARLLSYLKDNVTTATYWNGILFPHIRKIQTRVRHNTRPQTIGLQTLSASNDFLTGMRVHAWVESTKDQFDKAYAIEEKLPFHPLNTYARSLVEDELLYDSYPDWAGIQKSLRIICDDELYYIHERKTVRAWHDILTAYFQERPTSTSRLLFSKSIGLSDTIAQEINTLTETLLELPSTHTALEQYVRSLEHMIA